MKVQVSCNGLVQNATAIKATFSGGMEAFDAADVAQLHP